MHHILLALFGIVVATSSGGSNDQQLPIDVSAWTPEIHDRFVADTKSNIGYIVHEKGGFTMFRIGSGQRKIVNYMSRTYDAATPSKKWTVLSTTIQTDQDSFGKEGHFLRLYDNKEYTAYGIHTTDNIQKILSADDRYKSFGCVLVSEQVLSILMKTYTLNNNTLDIVTIEEIEAAQ